MHSYGTPHYAGPNRSVDRPRRVYIVNVANKTRFQQLFAGAASGERGDRGAGSTAV